MRKSIAYQKSGKIEKWFVSNKNKANHFFALAALLVTASSIFQDYLFSEINNTGFYLREVLLFKIFWLFFIPFSYLTFFLHNKLSQLSIKPLHRILALILIITSLFGVQVLSSSVLISNLGTAWFGFRITVWQLITTKLIDYLGIAFLFYVLSIWVAEYIYRTNEKLKKNKEVKIITVREGKKVIPINVSEIKWISSDKPYISIHTRKGRFLHSSTLKEILDELDNSNFVRIHRSTIVNVLEIEKLVSRLNGDYDVLMKAGEELRLSRNYKDRLNSRFF
ncbi:MAG: LytTR family DNA-binding domain-containing protein [Balneola sp.]